MNNLQAEYERLCGLRLGHTRDDVKLRILRARMSQLVHPCSFCGALPWELCRSRQSNRRATVPHRARRELAVAELIRQGRQP